MINDLITTNNLDFMFLIETWLEDNCSATVLTETAPPNFNFISVCRTVRRGGGVAALFKDVYQCKQVSFGQYLSFEYLGIVAERCPTHSVYHNLQAANNILQPLLKSSQNCYQ